MKFNKIPLYILTVAGFVLSVLSATDLCSFSGCTDAHLYRLYGMPLWSTGLIFFLLYFLYLILKPSPFSGYIDSALLSAAAGAEAAFIYIQKYIIEAWCPLCLAIATVILLMTILRISSFASSIKKGEYMKIELYKRSFFSLLVALTVFIATFSGMKKTEAEASDLNLYNGKQKSPVEVYVFSDWFCPSCIKAEPAIEAAYPAIAAKAKILFVDKPLHPEAMNYVPYHISFLVHEKDKYISLRKALFELAKKTKNPTVEDVKKAVSPYNVTYKQLSFMEVTQSMTFFQKLSDQYKIKGTPTVIIKNVKTNKVRTLYGSNEISKDALIKTVQELSK